MEFNVFEQFKGFERTGEAPRTPEEQGTRLFLGGHLGPRLEEHIDDAAARARMSRRNFLATASALPAAMLAVNKVTGMRFFDVTQAEAKQRWPTRTVMLGGGLTPNQGLSETLERMTMFVEKYQISGLKLYTFDSTKKRGWWFDDQKLAYPMWEKARKLGLKNIGCHKGIPFGQFMARYAHPEDLDAVCDDFTDLNFIAYHSAWPYQHELAALKGFKPQRKNLYAEVGSTFAATVTNRPLECAHVLGTLLRDLGPDYVMWGTDSALWGNPQWQIDAFRKFQIPEQLVEGHGYPPLTPELKAKVFGLNAARIWNLKASASAAQSA